MVILSYIFEIIRKASYRVMSGQTSQQGHNWAKDSGEEDRVESLIKKSGCWDQHLAVVDCMGDKGDWRQCQEALGSFKSCMIKSREQQIQASQKNK